MSETTFDRLSRDAGGPHMIAALLGWRDFCAPQRTTLVLEPANDNEVRLDNTMDTGGTAERAIKRHKAGKYWKPDDERFTRPRRNDPAKAIPSNMAARNGEAYHQAEIDAEDEAIRLIDASKARVRLGHVCARLLDLASEGTPEAEAARMVKQPGDARISKWIDNATIQWMRDPAYYDYAA
jgi:hypothetical protein